MDMPHLIRSEGHRMLIVLSIAKVCVIGSKDLRQ